jgi:hypothetical protein
VLEPKLQIAGLPIYFLTNYRVFFAPRRFFLWICCAPPPNKLFQSKAFEVIDYTAAQRKLPARIIKVLVSPLWHGVEA